MAPEDNQIQVQAPGRLQPAGALAVHRLHSSSRRRDAQAESWHYRWRYELLPAGDGAPVATESFDLSRPAGHQDGTTWVEAMTQTLERLERLCAPAEAPGGR